MSLRAASGIGAERREPHGSHRRSISSAISYRTYFDNAGSGVTLSSGAPACMVISVIETKP
jgi:hypothetical protein